MGSKQEQSEHQILRRKAPGILRLLPECLPFYPYKTAQNKHQWRCRQRRSLDKTMLSLVNGDYQAGVIPNAPLRRACDDEALLRLNGGFTLFFLVDSTNRQSLSALPIVSQWCHHALNHGGNDTCVCIPNHPVTANENDLCHFSDSNLPTAKEQVSHMLSNTGFYHLHFSHPKRIFLLKILGVTRVPCVVVVSNADGRIVTRYGW